MAERRGRSLVTRLTSRYVALAIVLVVGVAGASTVFAFLNYAANVNAAIAADTTRVQTDAQAAAKRGQTLRQMAPALYDDVKRKRRHVFITSTNGARIFGDPPLQPNERTPFLSAVGELIGLQAARIDVPGGRVVVAPLPLELSRTLRTYWELMLPIGLLAIFLAWFVGRAISQRAVAPLDDVTKALKRLGQGDLAPGAVTHADRDEIGELAAAYNSAVAQVQTALGQRERSEGEMRRFIADAGHELRTPLTVLLGYLDLLEAGAITEAAVASRVYDSMRQESERMRALIDKLVFLARLEQPPRRAQDRVDVGAVAQDVVEVFRAAGLGERLRIERSGNATVIADESEIYEALRNVVDNALKYAPGSPIAVRVAADSEHVTASVADQGPGMSADERVHAFERFYRGVPRGAVGGSGLGLAIAKRAVERANGGIELASEPGVGTTVTLQLPVGASSA